MPKKKLKVNHRDKNLVSISVAAEEEIGMHAAKRPNPKTSIERLPKGSRSAAPNNALGW